MAYLLTIDVGTSSTKTALWDETGSIVAESVSAYSLQRPHPLWAEIEAEIWWDAVCSTIEQVISGINPHDIAGIGVDSVGWTLIPVDTTGTPLSPAMIWLDRRAEQEAAWLKAIPEADRLVYLAANPLDAAYITPKLLWLKQHQPQIFDRSTQFLSATGFIVACLTGEFTCDMTQAYGNHFFDITQERWDEWAASVIGVSLEKMPPLYTPTEIVGAVTATASSQTGLPVNIPVIAGCLDAAAGALGAGVTRLGQTNEQGGQAGGFAVSVDRIVVEPQLIFSHHVIRGQYLLQAGTVGGGSLSWFRNIVGNANALSFEALSLEVQQASPGSEGLIFLPYMAGERTPLWNSQARGVFFGLSYKTTRADMIRAVMEGCAFAVRDNLAVAEAKGVMVTEFLGSGGAIQSAVWCQIKADVYGVPLVVARRSDGGEGGHSLGLFALTAAGLGYADDIGECVERLLPNRQVFEPSPSRYELYEELFSIYRDVSRKLLSDFDRLGDFTR